MSSLVQLAKESFLSNNFGKSYLLLLKNLKRNPDDTKANFLLGSLCMKTNKYDMAKGYLSKCLQQKPRQKKFIYQMAVLLMMTGKLSQSKELFEKYLKLNTFNAKVYFSLATIYEYQNDYKQARQNYLKCLQLEPNHERSRCALEKLSKKIGQMSQESREDLQKKFLAIQYKCKRIQQEKQKLLCKKCKNNDSSFVSQVCGHLNLCQDCKHTSNQCFICKKPSEFFKIFMV